jgi:hypothetical protein
MGSNGVKGEVGGMTKGYPGTYSLCLVAGCDKRAHGQGFCDNHYYRWRKHGDPCAGRVSPGVALKFLEDCVASRDRSECWKWPYSTNKGYGLVTFQGDQQTTCVAALVLDGKPQPAPPNHHSLHSCDYPTCFNPDHLRWGNHQENMSDQVARKRQQWGEINAFAKLKAADVRSIRIDPKSDQEVALSYGVKRITVARIRDGRTWKLLT